MLAIVCPGQGSQSPGFLTPWLDVPGVADRLAWLSAAAGLDLTGHGTTSDAETIRDTAVAQPLIVASGLAVLPALLPDGDPAAAGVSVVAGHSVGELTAAALAGVLGPEQAVVLVRERGRAMAAASASAPTGMSAVVGGDPGEVAEALERHGLTAANMNGAGQVVAAGTTEQLAALRADPPAKVRVVPLPVAGAFHTRHMGSAVDVLAGYAAAVATRDPRVTLLSNADGATVTGGTDVLARLVAQVSNPVRWDRCQEALVGLGVTGVIELPPAGTLTNLAKRAMPGVETLALRAPDDLDAARAMVERHADGVTVDLDSVVAPRAGRVAQCLVGDGDEVAPGQPILRLHPTGARS